MRQISQNVQPMKKLFPKLLIFGIKPQRSCIILLLLSPRNAGDADVRVVHFIINSGTAH